MHWIFKIIFIAICYAIDSSCRSLQLNPKHKGLKPVLSNSYTHGLPKEDDSILNGHFRHRRYPTRSSDNQQGDSFAKNLRHRTPDKLYNKNEVKRRGLNVGVLVKIPTTKKYDSDLEKLEAMVAKDLADRLAEEKYFNTSACPSCDKEEMQEMIEHSIKPAYKCDEWNPKHRACILERNIGDTVTFYLSTGKTEEIHKTNIIWKKEFHVRDSTERKEFVIDPLNPPENVIIGKKGFEFRISPITETDVAYNLFSAIVQMSGASVKNKLYFMIRIVPIDLGFVYVGETIELNLRKFVSLPERSVSYKWYMEKDGEHGTLPSNMKVSVTGSSIKIYELRQEQEGILACSVYTNLDILATTKRFLIKDLFKNKDVLQTSPNHTLKFKEEFRKKRYPKKELTRSSSSLRHARQNRAQLTDEEALFQPHTTDNVIPPHYNDYNSSMVIQNEESQIFKRNEARSQENMDSPADSRNLPENGQDDAYMSRNLPAEEEEEEEEELVGGQRSLDHPQITSEARRSKLDGNSNIILNIGGGAKGSHKVTAEMELAKLISQCVNDFECSVTASCVRASLKTPGFCKCLPGANGVGIFCREEAWLGNRNLDLEERDSDYLANTPTPKY